MIEIRPPRDITQADVKHLIKGYTSNSKYVVSRSESDDRFGFSLELAALAEPFVKRYDHLDGATLAHYQLLSHNDYSLAAYDKGHYVGIALAEPQLWNKSLRVLEVHIAETHQRQGIGRGLLEQLTLKARDTNLRTIVCETQNTNPAAIAFYRSRGFRIEGIDLSYYSNEDYPDGEIAIFMKKRID